MQLYGDEYGIWIGKDFYPFSKIKQMEDENLYNFLNKLQRIEFQSGYDRGYGEGYADAMCEENPILLK